MRIAVCDDEQHCIDEISGLLNDFMLRHNNLHMDTTSFSTGLELLNDFALHKYDIIFLDVYMPEMNGLETAGKIRELDLDVLIVFVTYARDHMGQSFSVTAADYLIKPVDKSDFDKTLSRLLSLLNHRQNRDYTMQLKGGGTISIPLSNILYFVSTKHYLKAVTAKDEFEFLGKLSDEEIHLKKEGFLRTHQSYLVNMEHIFIRFDTCVSLIDGREIPISRKCANAVKESYSFYRKGVL